MNCFHSAFGVFHSAFPMSFSKSAACELLRRAHEPRRLAHAYLITGPRGSGKRELALRVSELVTKSNQTSNLKPQKSVHPDIHIAEPESKSRRIVIEQIRELEKEL